MKGHAVEAQLIMRHYDGFTPEWKAARADLVEKVLVPAVSSQ